MSGVAAQAIEPGLQWNLYQVDPLLRGHQCRSLNFLPTFTLKLTCVQQTPLLSGCNTNIKPFCCTKPAVHYFLSRHFKGFLLLRAVSDILKINIVQQCHFKAK